MLKEAVASKAAKLLMTCVCPVAGTTALSLGVPQVRDAVHKAVQPRQYAKSKIRVRPTEAVGAQVASAETCPSVTPFAVGDMPKQVAGLSSGALSPSAPLVVSDALAQVTAASSQAGVSQQRMAELPQPETGVPLTGHIFIPPNNGVSLTTPADGSTNAAWVQIVLGFGLVGFPRVKYRRNGKADSEGEQA